MTDRIRTLFHRFAANEDGAVAIEGAFVGGLLAIAAVGFIEIRGTATRAAQLSDAAIASSQYIVRGGNDLSRLKQLVDANYGKPVDAFKTAVVCTNTFTIDQNGQVDQIEIDTFESAMVKPALPAKTSGGGWTPCADASDERFLEIFASVNASSSLTGQTSISTRLRMPLPGGGV